MIQLVPKPFVYIVDSPSSNDLLSGYTIGMALKGVLYAINIPCAYIRVVAK